MTTLAEPSELAVRGTSADVRATVELRQALTDQGYPSPRVAVRFERDRSGMRAVIAIPPSIPWRVADAAVARTLREVRTAFPEVHWSGRRFEECRAPTG